jgi:hypothetical protein
MSASPSLAGASEFFQGDYFMHISVIALAAAAAAQTGAPQSAATWVPLQPAQSSQPAPKAKVDPDQARAAGYAQAQQALTGDDNAAQQAAVAPVAQVPTVATGAVPQPLALTCVGGGTADKQRGSLLAGGWGLASVVTHHDRQFQDQIDVRLFSGDDRIRIPRTMLPGMHGGQDGWFKLKDVVADARAIHAHAAVAAFHNPQVYIDRVTGTISISGKSGDYSGQCQAMDPNAAAKF